MSPVDEELLSAYLDGALTASERAALERRLESDPVLRATLDDLRRTVAILNAAPLLAPPRNFTLDPVRYGRRRAAIPVGLLRLGAALAAALIVVSAVVLLNLNNAAKPGQTSAGANNPIALLPTNTQVQDNFLATSSSRNFEATTQATRLTPTVQPTLAYAAPLLATQPPMALAATSIPATQIAQAATFLPTPTARSQKSAGQPTITLVAASAAHAFTATPLPTPTAAPAAQSAASGAASSQDSSNNGGSGGSSGGSVSPGVAAPPVSYPNLLRALLRWLLNLLDLRLP